MARVRSLEQHPLALRHVDRRTRALGEVGHAEQMVEVSVRDEDRRAFRSETRQREAQLGRIAARVDDDRLRRAELGADDVAVRPDGSERELFDAEHGGACQLPRRPAACSPRSRRRIAWR